MTYRRQRFRVVLLRSGKGQRIDKLVESLDWTDTDELLRGSLTIRLPWDSNIAISVGDEIRLDYDKLGNDNWRELWTMRIWERNKGVSDGSQTLTLANDLERLVRSEDDWRYVQEKKKKPKGWTAEEVIRDVCSRYDVQLAKAVPRLDTRITDLERDETAPRDMIQEALDRHEQKTGLVYIMRYEKGTLYIDGKRRNYTLKLLAPEILNMLLTWLVREQFATEVTVKAGKNIDSGTDFKKHEKKKQATYTVTVATQEGRKRFGYVHRIVYAKDVNSKAEAMAVGKRWLTKVAVPKRTATISQLTLPTVRRFDAVKVSVPAEGLKFDIWVISATHRVDSAGYEGDLTLQFDNPWETEFDKQVAETLDEVATEKGRVAAKDKPKPAADPQPQKNRTREEHGGPTLGGLGDRARP